MSAAATNDTRHRNSRRNFTFTVRKSRAGFGTVKGAHEPGHGRQHRAHPSKTAKDRPPSVVLMSGKLKLRLRHPRQSVGLRGVLLAFDEALQVRFLAWLHSDRRALSLGDRLPANHTDGFLTASLLPHKGTPHSFLTPTLADTLRLRGLRCQ